MKQRKIIVVSHCRLKRDCLKQAHSKIFRLPLKYTKIPFDHKSAVCKLIHFEWARPDGATLSRRVFIVFDEPCQAKVGDLAHQTVPDQDVGGAQVSVNVVHPLDVRHACRHLGQTRLSPT